jgi:hypothetical protein
MIIAAIKVDDLISLTHSVWKHPLQAVCDRARIPLILRKARAHRARLQLRLRIFFTALVTARLSWNQPLRKYQIQIAPIFCSAGTLADPVGIVVQVIGNLCRPVTAKPAIVDVPFQRLAEAGCTAGSIDFPTGREDEAAPHGHPHPWPGLLLALQRNNILFRGIDQVVDKTRLSVDRSQMFHERAFL